MTFIMITTSCLFMLLGVMNGNPGAMKVGTVYFLWPILFTFVISGVTNKKTIRTLVLLMVFATALIGLYTLDYIAYMLGWIPEWLYIELNAGQDIGIHAGYTEFNLFSIASIVYLTPFSIAALLFWSKDSAAPLTRLWLLPAFALGLVAVLLSGRRALLLVVALSPLIAIVLNTLSSKDGRFPIRPLLAFLVGAFGIYKVLEYTYGINADSILEMFFRGFDFSGDVSALARQEQFFALLEGWYNSPLIGSGHGAVASGSIRSDEMPWAYELSYLALLFHTGILGFTLYASGIVWIYFQGIAAARSSPFMKALLVPVLTGTTCFLIANGTNPYLAKFDYIWVIFLPVAIINYWLLSTQNVSRSDSMERSTFDNVLPPTSGSSVSKAGFQ